MQPDLDLRHEAKADLTTLMGHDRHMFVDVRHDFGFVLNDAERDETQLAAIRLRCIAPKACIPALARLASEDFSGVGCS